MKRKTEWELMSVVHAKGPNALRKTFFTLEMQIDTNYRVCLDYIIIIFIIETQLSGERSRQW